MGRSPSSGPTPTLGAGDAFVVEADESDGTFVVYRPDIAVVTNVEPDHLDFYGTPAAVAEAYAEFAATVAPGGLLVASQDDPGARALADAQRAAGRRVVTFGVDPAADLCVVSSSPGGLGTRSLARMPDGTERELVLSVPGAHNVANACAALLAGVVGLDADPDAVLRGLAGFTGARRRFELRGEVGGVTVVDDYAHNPAKVAAVVSTAADVVARSGVGRLRVVFQPHLYSRTRDFAAEFAAALAPADHVVLLDIYGAREDPEPGVTSALVGDPLAARPGSRLVEVGLAPADAVASVVAAAGPGDLLLTVGAGDVTALGPQIVDALRAKGTGAAR